MIVEESEKEKYTTRDRDRCDKKIPSIRKQKIHSNQLEENEESRDQIGIASSSINFIIFDHVDLLQQLYEHFYIYFLIYFA